MTLPHSPAVQTPQRSQEIHPNPAPVQRSQEIHPPNFAQRVGDALLVAAIAVLPQAYKGIQLRQGTYIDSDANIVDTYLIPNVGRVVIFEQREGGMLGYVFEGDSAGDVEALMDLGETAGEIAGEAAII